MNLHSNEGNEEISEKNKNISDSSNKQINNEFNEINKNEILLNNNEKDFEKTQNKDNFLLNKKRKNENFQINEEDKSKIKKIENENKNNETYEYGYSIIFLEDKEEGLMEDFLIESDISDFYNYNLTPEKFDEILHHSILVHYERHLKEEMEKRKKMQNMFMLNMNINMNMNNNIIPPSMLPQMNPLMMSNINNSNNLNYPIQIAPIQNNNKNKNS